MAERNRYYAVGAVIRQLIECEYLLALFNEDLDYAKRWLESTPDEVRESFAPAKMRKLTGTFSNEEYWGHCSTGGHPAPKGARCSRSSIPDASPGHTLLPKSRLISASICVAYGRLLTPCWGSTMRGTNGSEPTNDAKRKRHGRVG
jgi:hypothetical protein